MAQTPTDDRTVWGNVWNPPTDEWDPNDEVMSPIDFKEQSHQDDPTAWPVSDEPGVPSGGSVPDVRANLLTEVQRTTTTPAPTTEIHHVIETIEPGSPIMRVRQATVSGNTTPTQIVEENPNRKRVLLRIVPVGAASVTTLDPANPAAGAALTVAVPVGQKWTVQSISFTYTASVAVANRIPFVQAFDSANRLLAQVDDATALTASQVDRYTLSPTMPASGHIVDTGANNFVTTLPFPAVTMTGDAAGNARIRIGANGIDAADQISSVSIQVLVQTNVPVGTADVFISPRSMGGSVAAPNVWTKMIAGDGPLEIKVTEGIDAICGNATDVSVVQITEEIEQTSHGVASAPGLT